MDNRNNKEIVLMEDEEDLEYLRLAALKSLNKKENVLKIANVDSHVIPVVSNVRYTNKFHANDVDTTLQRNPVPSFINAGVEKMEITDLFKNRLNSASASSYNEFIEFGKTVGFSEPKGRPLSPRSAAFVNENEQILKRRKGISPSLSPPFRKSVGRWSRSPSRESWKYRRSGSKSPHFRKRSTSRSPRRRYSPQLTRRNRSRSPIPRNTYENVSSRPTKRSPKNSNFSTNSPPNRNLSKGWRRESPLRDATSNIQRSNSPHDDVNYRSRRTRSPLNSNKYDGQRCSSSHSPNRKYSRLNTHRSRRSPYTKRIAKYNGSKRSNSNGRNRNYGRRSPIRSNSQQGDKRKSPVKCAENVKNTEEIDNNEKPIESERITDKTCDSNEKLLSNSDNSDSESNDGIDLFASEESESENEGRFKSNTNKSERKITVPKISFSELGKSAPDALLKDLDELQADSNHKVRKMERNGRRRDERRYDRGRDKDRKERHRDRDRDSKVFNWKNAKDERKDGDTSDPIKTDRKKCISNDIESRTKTPDDKTEHKSRANIEKRSSHSIKRPKTNTEKPESKSVQSSNENCSSPTNEIDNATTKKPIHMRLGAMTKTWKSNKKSWRTEKNVEAAS